ncbi:hypothetical protein [Sphingopyxis sp.]|uniref:hypothetical protein n=1 Tax=Sphingopyxis sp. TaxID=1908224 RepID=UPI003D6CDE27
MTDKTSAERLERHIRGRLIVDGAVRAPRDIIAQVFVRPAVEESFVVPAVAEPLLVWILAGEARVEERDPGGAWQASDVRAGDFFLTDSEKPYELRWRSLSTPLKADRPEPATSGHVCRAQRFDDPAIVDRALLAGRDRARTPRGSRHPRRGAVPYSGSGAH